jgi:hypothetical protein
MTVQAGLRPATAAAVDEPQEVDPRAPRIASRASPPSGNSQVHRCRPQATLIWSAEFPINQQKSLRVQMRQHKTHADLDLRRCHRSPDGDLQATGRGFAITARHLPQIKMLTDAAFMAAGLLDGAADE